MDPSLSETALTMRRPRTPDESCPYDTHGTAATGAMPVRSVDGDRHPDGRRLIELADHAGIVAAAPSAGDGQSAGGG